jgi:restriction endonuclease Mrr
LPEQTFDGNGDADVEATRADRFGEQKLLVQVKHHHDTSGRNGLKQLAAIQENEPEMWGDHDVVLVTTGNVPEEVQDKAGQVNVEVLGGGDLIDWLLDHVDVLSPKARRSLGISEIPFLMS